MLLDVESAYREATEHLIALGHRRIGFLSPMAREATKLSARYQGWWKALTEAGIEPADELIQHVPRPEDCGQALDGYWRLAEPPTALLAHNDMYGAYAIYALQGAGKRVPDDVSVFGFEHLPGQVPVSPALTTARIPIEAIGGAQRSCFGDDAVRISPRRSPYFKRNSCSESTDRSSRGVTWLGKVFRLFGNLRRWWSGVSKDRTVIRKKFQCLGVPIGLTIEIEQRGRPMTRRERMFTTLSHRQPDMIPWQIGFTIEAHAKMVDYLKDPAFTEKIGTISPASCRPV